MTATRLPMTVRNVSGRRRGLTLVEAAITVVAVATMTGVTLSFVIGMDGTLRTHPDRLRHQLLGEALMTEILSQAYLEPEGPPSGFGPDEGESAEDDRYTLDDVDDYNGLRDEPPMRIDGEMIPGFDQLQRTVEVVWVESDNLVDPANTETGAKRITVSTSVAGRQTSSLMAVRTRENLPPQAGIAVEARQGGRWMCRVIDYFDPDSEERPTCLWVFRNGNTNPVNTRIATGETVLSPPAFGESFEIRLKVYDGQGGTAEYRTEVGG